jgi:hypothetical protein
MPTWGGYWGDPWGYYLASVPYIGVAQAQAECFDEMLYVEAWDNASDADKLTALKFATHIIDLLPYTGYKTGRDAQERAFPRDTSKDVIPNAVRHATCHVALRLLQGWTYEQEDEERAQESVRVGGASYRRARIAKRQARLDVTLGLPSAVAAAYLGPYVYDARQPVLLRGVRYGWRQQ